MGDDPASFTFTVAMDDPQLIRADLSVESSTRFAGST
jgi:hypothetical protein